MKKLLSILVAGAIGYGAAFFMVSSQRDAAIKDKARIEAEMQAKVDALEKDLAAAKNRRDRVQRVAGETTEVQVAAQRSAKEILEKLQTLRPSGPTRIAMIRKIVHELEDLADLKDEAVPAIQEFLAQNTDIDYAPTEQPDDNGGANGNSGNTNNSSDRRRRGGPGGGSPPWSRNRAETEFTLPPSLRIGLFDVLKEIGSGTAEEALAQVLQTSGRAVEVAYVARMLEEIVPTKYKFMAIDAAKSLLRNPVAIDSPNRLDDAAEGYLYGVLEMYGDTTFATEASKSLISADGQLDRNVRDYLTKTQGEKAVPALYQAYKSGVISNDWDRMSIGSKILDYAGQNPDANKFLNEIVTNPDLDSRMKSFAIMRLAGGFGSSESPTDPEVIKSRQDLLTKLASSVSQNGTPDERLSRAIVLTDENLTKLANGEPITKPDWGRGGDRNGGPGGDPNAPGGGFNGGGGYNGGGGSNRGNGQGTSQGSGGRPGK